MKEKIQNICPYCGREYSVNKWNWEHGVVRSCGCLAKESARKRMTTHGQSRRSVNYQTWVNIRKQGTEESWKEYTQFIADVGDRPPNHFAFRPDKALPWGKDNFIWVTKAYASCHQKNNLRLEFRGIILTIPQWEKVTGIQVRTIRARLRRGWNVEKTLCYYPQIGRNQSDWRWEYYKRTREEGQTEFDLGECIIERAKEMFTLQEKGE